uniref:Uncharacterized protein n=1 Tax=Parascaris univalens TaxID=6257 RepID=A0A915BJF0_PARUN
DYVVPWESERNAPELKSILCKRRKRGAERSFVESGTDRRVHFTADVKTATPLAKMAKRGILTEKSPSCDYNVFSTSTRSTHCTHNTSASLNLIPTTFYQSAYLPVNSLQSDASAQSVRLSNEARKQVQLLTVKALEQENELLRQRILQKRLELMYLLRQCTDQSLPRIPPSNYETSEDDDSFRIIRETLNTLFVD